MVSHQAYKTVPLESLVDFEKTNTRLNKAFCRQYPGPIPVYGASKHDAIVLGHIEDCLPEVRYYQNCVACNLNGSVGYAFVRRERFSASSGHQPMKVKATLESQLSLEYLKHQIETRLISRGFSYANKCQVKNLKALPIRLPVDSAGRFDVERQSALIKTHHRLAMLKTKIAACHKRMKALTFEINGTLKTKRVRLQEIFDFQKGKDITQRQIDDSPGEYPVYSSNTLNQGTLGFIKTYDYDCEGITWTKSGSYAGVTFYRNGKFSMSGGCGLMTLKPAFVGQIDVQYAQSILNLKPLVIGQGNKGLHRHRILNANIYLDIPVKVNHTFDMVAQQALFAQHQTLEAIRARVEQALQTISAVNIAEPE